MLEALHEATDLFTELDRLLPLVRARRWVEVERSAREMCALLAGRECAESIAAVDTARYEADLRRSARDAAESCPADAEVVYFEFDPDDAWEGTFFICPEYCREEEREDEWVCGWLHHVPGPEFEPFARLYVEHGCYKRGSAASGAALYLIIRTLCACGRAVEDVDFGPRPVCIAFHDADEVLHVRELP
ncbi:MAG: hypothetical protein L0Y66_10205 [Myxococcaceae bacterium]|nr:hypothetical protein [Myxococcaceae bacterium]